MRERIFAIVLVAMVAAPALAGDGVHGKHGGGKAGGVFCPHCGGNCYPTVTKETETKSCWDVESKTICIPRVRFPWEPGGCGKGCGGKGGGKDGKACGKYGCGDVCCPAPKCGRTKCVNVLMKYEYECTVCKYSWDPDSFKNGKDKYYDRQQMQQAPMEATPDAPQPPAIDARRQIRQPVHTRAAQVSHQAPVQPQPAATPSRSFTQRLVDIF